MSGMTKGKSGGDKGKMEDKLLTIQKAAKLLRVSITTLRRYDKNGVLTPRRTPGNQRRYSLKQVQEFIQTPSHVISNPSVISNEVRNLQEISRHFVPRDDNEPPRNDNEDEMPKRVQHDKEEIASSSFDKLSTSRNDTEELN